MGPFRVYVALQGEWDPYECRAGGTEHSQENLLNYFVWIAAKYEIILTLLLGSDHSSETSDSNRRPIS